MELGLHSEPERPKSSIATRCFGECIAVADVFDIGDCDCEFVALLSVFHTTFRGYGVPGSGDLLRPTLGEQKVTVSLSETLLCRPPGVLPTILLRRVSSDSRRRDVDECPTQVPSTEDSPSSTPHPGDLPAAANAKTSASGTPSEKTSMFTPVPGRAPIDRRDAPRVGTWKGAAGG